MKMEIFCEGESDKEFIIKLLQHIDEKGELKTRPQNEGFIGIPGSGSKPELLKVKNYIATTDRIKNKKTKKVLFILDADFNEDGKCNGLEKTQKCIEDLINQLNWNAEVGYFIFDKNLDDFIIKTLDNKSDFEACEQCFELKKANKNRKILTCIYRKLYPEKPYDFSHKNFDPLKEKLIQLFI